LAPMAVRAGEIEADMDTATQSLSQAMRQYTPAIKEGMPGAIVMFLKPEQYAIAKQYTPSDRAAIEDKMVTYLPNEKIRIIIAEDTEANRARVKGELEGVVPPERVMAFVVAAPGEVDAQNEALKPWACPIVLIGKAQSGQVPFVRIDRCARSGFEGLNVQEIMARPNATEGDKLQAAQRFANSLGGVADGDLGEDLKKIVDAVIENKGLKDLLISIEIRPADINELPDIERGIKEILRAA